MAYNFHSYETERAKRRSQNLDTVIQANYNGEMVDVPLKVTNGEMETYELSKAIGEMMTSEDTKKELLQKVVLDVELGREEVPTLYQPIYEQMSDSNFPKEFEAKWAQHGQVIFFEHIEGEEVKFGSMAAEEGPIARLKGYSSGFEYTKEMEMFNQTFNLEMLNRAFGEAYNAILNHMHLSPFFNFSYTSANQTGAQYVDQNGKELADATGSHYILSLRQTLKQALRDARTAGRPGTVLLINPADTEDIDEALSAFTIGATPYRSLEGIQNVIAYDGWDTQVGQKTYTYEGVPAGKAYLIRPKRGFKELIKQDLQINANMGDLTRLVESQVVGDFWRGVFAAVEENVQEITMPTRS